MLLYVFFLPPTYIVCLFGMLVVDTILYGPENRFIDGIFLDILWHLDTQHGHKSKQSASKLRDFACV